VRAFDFPNAFHLEFLQDAQAGAAMGDMEMISQQYRTLSRTFGTGSLSAKKADGVAVRLGRDTNYAKSHRTKLYATIKPYLINNERVHLVRVLHQPMPFVLVEPG